jgi:glycosyltransferase involved in cell wall biosynthesis
MKVISFGIYSKRPEYPRQRNLIDGLECNGVEVLECHYSMTTSFKERLKSAQTFGGRIKYLLRLSGSYFSLAFQFLKNPPADAILVGYPGYFHVRFVRLLQLVKNRRAVLVYDIFFSLYDAMVYDRKMLGAKSLGARLIRAVEKDACRAADICLIDTDTHGDYLSEELAVPREKIKRVFVGPTFPLSDPLSRGKGETERFHIVFAGTYIPLHGIDTILAAAEKLKDDKDVFFTLAGTGQLREEMEEKARKSHLTNVRFVDWVSHEELPGFLRSGGLTLGIFGTTGKASRVIPIKVFDICAAAAPLVTADTPAIRESFRHAENAYLVRPGDPIALAEAILELKGNGDLRVKIAHGAHELARTVSSMEEIGKELVRAIVDHGSGSA